MLKIQRFKNFAGFGNGSKYSYGEYVHSQGMNKSPNGILPLWNVLSTTDSDSLTTLDRPNFFAQAKPAASIFVYLTDILGTIFQSLGGIGAWSLGYKPGVTTHGNGLIGDQKNRLLYPMTRYLGKYDGTADYTTGTIAVTNGSPNIVGTGTTFTSGMVNKRIVIAGVWYTIATFTDATHIALSVNYAGSTASGLSYAIKVGWDDKFKDFGASSLADDADFRDSCTFEDWVAFCNGNKIALLNVTDDSFNDTAFDLPSGFKTRSVKSGRTGMLIGANFGNRCALILWTPETTRSVAPWIWKNGTVQAIVSDPDGNWIVVTNREIILTNGYTAQNLVPVPDDLANQLSFNVHPQGIEIVGNYLIIGNRVETVSRMRGGYWILNLKTLLWEYAPVSNGSTMNSAAGPGPIFYDSNFAVHAGWATSIPQIKHIGQISNGQPSRGYLITQPLGEGNEVKVSEAVKLNFGISPYQTASYPISFDVAVKIYNFKRALWTYGQQKINSTDHDRITVDGSVSGLNNAEVGDEITIMEGANAGFVSHISEITGKNTSTEVWMLEDSFSEDIEENVVVQVMPFKLVKKYSLSELIELKPLFFNVKNKLKGQKFLIKILLENIGNVPPELLEGEFIYDELDPYTV